MAKYKTIFFDVGNTLLFPNRSRILAPLEGRKHPSLSEWQSLERRTKQEFDQGLLTGKVDHGFWWTFHTHLLHGINAFDEATRDQLVSNTQNSSNWDQVLPGTREAVDRIRQKYSTAVISNSDGRIVEVLRRCGLGGCFASVTDSGIVGHEKPHPAIFAAALQTMKADPAECLHVGDLYSVDYVGSRNAGMQAVIFDVSGAYRDRDLPRVETLAQLENWLDN
ncbi:MAG TPA: HAD family hydrolase [Candidatus Sulfotelmatobacter sp.]|nr:HAD family hydrolase [Candidatus Sulfotelmatobacter sp.]